MQFSSILFIIFFFPVSVILYYPAPAKYKPHILLIISSVFCTMISLRLLIFTYILIAANYFLARLLKGRFKKIIYFLALIINISILMAMKISPSGNPFLPVCVSFFMMEFIGYLTDIYKGKISYEKNFINFALYIMFFPKFPMGAVISYQEFYPFLKRSRINLSILGRGIIIFIKGLSKNIIIGGSLYPIWQTVKNIEPERLSALSAALGILAFALSFYFCLSGILDMSAGLSRCFGYKLPHDFEHPFFAPGLSDFLSRWHMNTVRWFKNYIYNPAEKFSPAFACILMWILIGLWYEFSLNKLIWGLLMGLGLIIEKSFRHKNMLYAFIIKLLGWIFFSQPAIMDSLKFIKALIGGCHGFADSLSLYLLQSYTVILLIAVYTSTDLFKNLTEKIKDNRYLSVPLRLILPFTDIILLIIDIAIIASGRIDNFSVLFG